MDNGQWPTVRSVAERQGWVIDDTKNGFQIKSPDGRSIVTMDRLHKSSDPHALSRTVNRMRKGGFLWPPPKAGSSQL